MQPEIRLSSNSKAFYGWKSLKVARGIETVASTFELGITEDVSKKLKQAKIRRGDKARLWIDNDTVVTGFVNARRPTYDANTFNITVSGRDKTGDLVDCSAVYKGGQFLDQNFGQIAKALCEPFDIKVHIYANVGEKFKKFKLQEGETVFEALERGARHRGLLLMSDSLDGLVITTAGKDRIATPLVLGENILSASGEFGEVDRFSRYTVKSQTTGDDWKTTEQIASPVGVVLDKNIRRHRPLIILAEESSDAKACKDRATWERNVRAARGSRITYTVAGWKHAGGLWLPNHMVPVKDALMGVDRELLITQVVYILENKKYTTEITVTDRSAYDILATPEEDDSWPG